MNFKDVKRKVIECLKEGLILHEVRNHIDVKNLLSTGSISVDYLIEIIRRSRGNNYTCSPHHFYTTIDVHVINTNYSGQNWYIKWYFIEPDCIFISVHN